MFLSMAVASLSLQCGIVSKSSRFRPKLARLWESGRKFRIWWLGGKACFSQNFGQIKIGYFRRLKLFLRVSICQGLLKAFRVFQCASYIHIFNLLITGVHHSSDRSFLICEQTIIYMSL